MQLLAVPTYSYVLVPDRAICRRLMHLWLAAADSVQLDVASVAAENYYQDYLPSMFGR